MSVRQAAPRWLLRLCSILLSLFLLLSLTLGAVLYWQARQAASSKFFPAWHETHTTLPLSEDGAQTDQAAGQELVSQDSVLLYRIQDNQLIYNVTHTAGVENARVVDLTGSHITTLEQLSQRLEEQTWAFTANLILDEPSNTTAICLIHRFPRPVIGLSWSSDGQDYTSYMEILRRNGAIPLELPQITDAASAQAALAQVDGIMVTGGEDIDPVLYGDEITPNGSNDINTIRDTSDYNLIQQAIAADLPMLAVCRGCQMLNVALGGGLIQDITTYLNDNQLPLPEETGVYHKNDGTQYHDINQIDPNAKWLCEILGAAQYPNAATFHHQAIDPTRMGQGLTPVAWTDDGIIEAVEYRSNRFALGIQFHPERDALGDTLPVDTDQDTCNRFFQALVNAAAEPSQP